MNHGLKCSVFAGFFEQPEPVSGTPGFLPLRPRPSRRPFGAGPLRITIGRLPDVNRHSRYVLDARGEELVAFIERLKARCMAAGHMIKRVILAHEAPHH
jgi:hypothetical protein